MAEVLVICLEVILASRGYWIGRQNDFSAHGLHIFLQRFLSCFYGQCSSPDIWETILWLKAPWKWCRNWKIIKSIYLGLTMTHCFKCAFYPISPSQPVKSVLIIQEKSRVRSLAAYLFAGPSSVTSGPPWEQTQGSSTSDASPEQLTMPGAGKLLLRFQRMVEKDHQGKHRVLSD